MQHKKSSTNAGAVESQFVTIQGYHLHYRVAGVGSPLVLIHGYGVSGHVWDRVLPFLAQEHQVFVVDLPGYGRSLGSLSLSWYLHEMAPLLIKWLTLLHLTSFHLVGHSMGGAIAMHLASTIAKGEGYETTKLRISSLTLIDTAGMPFRVSLPVLVSRSAQSMLQAGNGSYPLPLVRDVLRPRLRLLWRGATQLASVDLRAELVALTMPTLIIWGQNDVLVPIVHGYELSTALPHALFIGLADCGHRPILAQPEKVSGILLAFFDDHENNGRLPIF